MQAVSTSVLSRCLDANTIAAFVAGALSSEDAAAVEAHVDRCADCRRILSALAPSHPAPRGSSWRRLVKGVHIGRYVLEQPLGAGGMGIVWCAYDTELDRRVALKMVRGDVSRGEDFQNRLLREAQAMARLTHPNVVTVYDLVVHDRQLVLALERIDGTSLSQWLASAKPPWRDTLQAFLQAGRGLAAAHAVGLVHRDFKSDNVLRDHSGRICVTDFGLARLASSERETGTSAPLPPTRRNETKHEAEKTMTSHGTLLGTPRYMAPEQMRGEVADAQSDQFSFCIALYEALYGQLPTVTRPKNDSKVPAFIERVLLRGMSPMREERYPSMDALLTALSRDPSARWRRAASVTTIAIGLGAAVLFARHKSAQSSEVPCQAVEQRLSGVWDAAKKERIRRAFLALGKPAAESAWHGVERLLDAYGQAWVDVRAATCESDRAHRGLDTVDLRGAACLDDHLVQLRALTDVLEHADETIVENAYAAASSLLPASACRDPRTFLGEPAPPAPELASKVSELRERAAHVTALGETQKFKEAIPLAKQLAEDAHAVGYRPLEAQALLLQGRFFDGVRQPIDAEPLLFRAAWLADAAGDDRTRTVAWMHLLGNVGLRKLTRAEIIPFVREQAAAARERHRGEVDLEVRFLTSSALLASGTSRYEEAHALQLEVVHLLQTTSGNATWAYARALDDLARYELLLADYDRALKTLEDARAALERAGIVDNTLNAHVESSTGKVLLRLLRSREAEEHFRSAVRIQEHDDPRSQRMVVPLYNLGRALADQGRQEEALSAYDRAIALHEKYVPVEHPESLEFHTARATALVALGRGGEVLPLLKRILENEMSLRAPWRADTEFAYAQALTQAGREPRRARELAQSARERLARSIKTGPRLEREIAAVDTWLLAHR